MKHIEEITQIIECGLAGNVNGVQIHSLDLVQKLLKDGSMILQDRLSCSLVNK